MRRQDSESPPRSNAAAAPPSQHNRGARASLVSTLRSLPSQRSYGQTNPDGAPPSGTNNNNNNNSAAPPPGGVGSPTSGNQKMSLHQAIVAAAAAAGLKLSGLTPRRHEEGGNNSLTAADGPPMSQPGSRSNRLLAGPPADSATENMLSVQNSLYLEGGPHSSAALTEDNASSSGLLLPPHRLWDSWDQFFFQQPSLLAKIGGEPNASRYCKLFTDAEVPAPNDPDVLLHGLDNAVLDAIGVGIIGHRIAILAACRAATAMSSSPFRTGLPHPSPHTLPIRPRGEPTSSSSSTSSDGRHSRHAKRRTVRPHIYRAFKESSSSSSHHSSSSSSSSSGKGSGGGKGGASDDNSDNDSDDTRAKRKMQQARTQRTATVDLPPSNPRLASENVEDGSAVAGAAVAVGGGSGSGSGSRASGKRKSRVRLVVTNEEGDSSDPLLQNPPTDGGFSVQNDDDESSTNHTASRVAHTQSVFHPSDMRFTAPKSQWGDHTGLLSSDVVTQSVFTSRGRTPYTWIDLCGRDLKRVDFTASLRRIVERYHFEEALLLDIDLTLALPQLITVPNEPEQFLIILRGAAAETSIREDSLHLLTSRLMIAVNRTTRAVVSVHRRDSKFLAELREDFASEYAERSMSVLLCKLLDDTLISYVDAIHDSESLLDRYEARMLKQTMDSETDNFIVWLWRLLTGGIGLASHEEQDMHEYDGIKRLRNKEYADEMMASQNFSRQKMNQLLYHLHRRCSVYSRMLTLTKTTLEETYAALHLASGDYAEQVGRSCSELAMKAESLHDNCQNLLNLHLSLVSFRTNELMNVLTVMSSVFEPITFITGVYGMNFVNMPELLWWNGYYYCLGVMMFIVLSILLMFKRKGII